MKGFRLASLSCFLALSASPRVSAEEKIITLAPGKSEEDVIRSIEGMGGKYLRSLRLINAIVADLPPAAKGAGRYPAPGIAAIEEDPYIQWVSEPSGSRLSTETFEKKADPASKEIPWGVSAVKAPAVWGVTEGAGVKVAVLDSGINFKHPDLASNFAGGYNALAPGQAPIDDNGHGTLVAGIISAARDLKGVVGIAPKASLYAVKVLDRRNGGKLSGIIAGLQWAVDNKMDIVNMSFGTPTAAPALEKAVNAAVENGLTLICATGNEPGPVNYPAKYAAAIAVTASDSRGNILDVASTGPEVDFIAPGIAIRTTSKNGHYDYDVSGTSFAAPHVTGVAALAAGLGIKGPEELRKALARSAQDLHLSPFEQGAGQVDAGKLLSGINPK